MNKFAESVINNMQLEHSLVYSMEIVFNLVLAFENEYFGDLDTTRQLKGVGNTIHCKLFTGMSAQSSYL